MLYLFCHSPTKQKRFRMIYDTLESVKGNRMLPKNRLHQHKSFFSQTIKRIYHTQYLTYQVLYHCYFIINLDNVNFAIKWFCDMHIFSIYFYNVLNLYCSIYETLQLYVVVIKIHNSYLMICIWRQSIFFFSRLSIPISLHSWESCTKI